MHGRVQGVGYRYFVVERAQQLGLAGWVRNLPDGTVEAMAEGPEQPLHTLLRLLARGPSGARVSGIDESWAAASGEFDGFTVRRP